MNIKVVIEVASTRISGIVAELLPGAQPHILAAATKPSDGFNGKTIENFEKLAHTLKLLVLELADVSQIDIKSVDVLVSCDSAHVELESAILAIPSASEAVTRNEIDRLADEIQKMKISAEAAIYHALPINYRIDSNAPTTDPVGQLGKRIEGNFAIFTGSRLLRDQVGKLFARVGLVVASVGFGTVQFASFISSVFAAEHTVAVIDVGHKSTTVLLAANNALVNARVLPFGGWHITEDIKKITGISSSQAERLKIKFASALGSGSTDAISVVGVGGRTSTEVSQAMLDSIVRSRMEEIASYVFLSLEQMADDVSHISSLFLVGQSSLMKGTPDLFSYISGTEVVVADASLFQYTGAFPDDSFLLYLSALSLCFGDVHTLSSSSVSSASRLTSPRPDSRLLSRMKTWFEGSISTSRID